MSLLDKACTEKGVDNSFSNKLKLMFYAGITRLRLALTKWRLLFLGFVLIYAVLLLINLTKPPILWDEVSHLNGGSLLYFGLYDKFVSVAFYPPLFDAFTFLSFKLFGISLFTARLPSVIFAVLALWSVFELAHYMYNGKVALLSSIMLGIMPGFFWLSGYAMLETILVFFVTASLLCFYHWLNTRQTRMLVLSGLALGLGFLAKYQILVVGVIMMFAIIFLMRKQVKFAFKKLSLVIAAAVLVVSPWVVIAYQAYRTGFLGQWFYVLQTGNPGRSVYSSRFPLPIFYFIEMTWPHDNFHPISIFCYILGLAGIAWMVWRHRSGEKFLLLWFAIIFGFYTLIPNKDWRYVIPLFPILAIAASDSVLSLGDTLHKIWKKSCSTLRKHLAKVASVALIVTVVGAMSYSVYESYTFTMNHHLPVGIKDATDFAVANIEDGKSIMVLLPCNLFNQDMVQFYVWAQNNRDIELFSYPELAVDAYTPEFNLTEFIEQCRQHNVQYIFIFEYGGANVPFYDTTLTLREVYEQLHGSDNFTDITDEQSFGINPWRIFVIDFVG